MVGCVGMVVANEFSGGGESCTAVAISDQMEEV